MTCRLQRLLPGFVLLTAASTAWCAADLSDLSLESLLQLQVEGASRFVQPLSEAPASVSVITGEDIRRFGFRNLGDALQSLRGVYTTNERDYSYLGIRGFARPGDYNTRMLLMVDGLRINDSLFDTAPISHEAPLEMDWIKRLEFVPGPGSALYGANALFGVANTVLWSGADIDGSRISASLGSNGMTRVGLLSGRRTENGGDWIVGVSAYQRRGEDLYFKAFDSPATGNGIAHGLDGERYLKAYAKLNANGWQIDAGLSTRHKNIPTAYYGTLFDTPGNFIQDDYGYASIRHSRILSADWNENLRLHFGSSRYQGEYVYGGLKNRDDADASSWGVDYLLTYTGLADHKLLLGSDWQRDQRLKQRNFDVAPVADHFDEQRTKSSLGIFVQDEWRIDQRWMTSLGLRMDQLADYSAVSPRAALIFHPRPEASLKLMHGRAFRAPNNYERYYNDGNVLQKANPALQPERITTDELAADYVLSSNLRLFGSIYRYRMDNLIEQVTDPADGLAVFINRPEIHARGVELEAESLLKNGLRIRGGISSQRLQQDFAQPVNSPQLMGKLQIDGPLFSSGWILGLTLRAMDRRNALTGQTPGHVIGNLALSQKASGKFGEWSLAIYNISGQRYLDPASSSQQQPTLPQDGRQLRLNWQLAY